MFELGSYESEVVFVKSNTSKFRFNDLDNAKIKNFKTKFALSTGVDIISFSSFVEFIAAGFSLRYSVIRMLEFNRCSAILLH